MQERGEQEILPNAESVSSLEEERDRLRIQMEQSGQRISELRTRYESEAKDVEKLGKRRIASALRKYSGSGKANREMLEMLSAKIEYEKERRHMTQISAMAKELENRIAAAKNESAPAAGNTAGADDPEPQTGRDDCPDTQAGIVIPCRALREETAEELARLVGNGAALNLAQKVLGSARASLEELVKAEKWTTPGIWGPPGLVSRSRRNSKIDFAKATFSRLFAQMRDLERELDGINFPDRPFFMDIPISTRLPEFWIDAADGEDRGDILAARQDKIRNTIDQIILLIEKLEINEKDIQARLSALEERKTLSPAESGVSVGSL